MPVPSSMPIPDICMLLVVRAAASSTGANASAAASDAPVRVEFARDVSLPMPSSPKRADAAAAAAAATTTTTTKHDIVESSPTAQQRGQEEYIRVETVISAVISAEEFDQTNQ